MLMNARAVIAAGAARTNIIRVAASGRRQSRYIISHKIYYAHTHTIYIGTQIIIICILLYTSGRLRTNWLPI